MTPVRSLPDDHRWPDVAALIHSSFAYMEPIMGHAARASSVTPGDLAAAAGAGSAWLIDDGSGPVGCLFTRPSRDIADALYLGWLAVDAAHRGQGLARRLNDAAKAEARAGACTALTLDTGRMLADLHRVFGRAGFQMHGGHAEIVMMVKPLA